MKRIVFCGFGKLGLCCLKRLIEEGYKMALIFTHRDLSDDGVDTFAEENNIPYSYEDARKNIKDAKEKVQQNNPDYLISVNYRYIIPRDIFDIPKYAINVHGSLLPKYRGRTPHVWSIINGEEYTGITSHLIEETVDAGDIIDQMKIKISETDTGYTLLQKYERLYPELLIRTLDKIEQGLPLVKQNECDASYFGKRTPDMGYIDFKKNARDIINFVRALAHPYPGAYYYLPTGEKIVINKLTVKEITDDLPIGVIRTIEGNLYVRCADSTLKILDYSIDKGE